MITVGRQSPNGGEPTATTREGDGMSEAKKLVEKLKTKGWRTEICLSCDEVGMRNPETGEFFKAFLREENNPFYERSLKKLKAADRNDKRG